MTRAGGDGSGARGGVARCERLVVKIGSAVVTDGTSLDAAHVGRIAGEVAVLIKAGRQVVIVSSGAVASGCEGMGLKTMPRKIAERQAAAAVGQSLLMRAWSSALARRKLVGAQVLLTDDDMHDRARFLNARRTLETLLARGIVPIVNENDSVAFDEIKLGDNDRLSALVCGLVGAGGLVMLSSAPGLMDKRRIVPCVTDIEAARALVRPGTSGVGTGGMGTKLEAAQIAGEHGTTTVLVSGHEQDALTRAARGEVIGTVFDLAGRAGRNQRAARKSWIRHAARGRGRVVVDDGAARALTARGASLLPKGVVGVEGSFAMGAVIDVVDPHGTRIGRGIAGYASDEIDKIRGCKTTEIRRVLGYAYCDEVIHRNDLVVTKKESGS